MSERRVSTRRGHHLAAYALGLAMLAAVASAAGEDRAGALAHQGAASPTSVAAPDTALSKEIRRVREDVDRVVPEAQRPALAERLQRAASALDAGRVYLALYELESAFEVASAFGFVQESEGMKTLADFSARWKSVGEPRGIDRRAGRALPALVEALAASAEARAPATYRASLPYAQDSDLRSGLFYLGESRALGAFARFARSLTWRSPGRAPSLRSLAPELDALDKEVAQAYERMSAAQHSTYMMTSVVLKRARTLNESGHYPGALFEYLLARYRFATLQSATPPAPPAPQRIAEARARVDAGMDHSIARLYVEMAEAALASDNAGDKSAAALILDEVLPAYHAAVGLAPPATAASAAAPAVTVTLVRWPFT